MGMDKTLEMISRNFYWLGMAEDIEDYVRSCDDCQRNKASQYKWHCTLHPLELSYSPWDSISMDFITHLPVSEGCTTIWVVVDRFTKMAHFIPIKEKQKTAEGCAKLFLLNVWRLHGLPSDIVSDRDPVFTSTFWAELMKKLNVRLRKSTAFRPQTDGQTERINQTLEHYLRQYCNYEQNDWYEMLPLAEYSYNNSVTTATQMSPFYVNYCFHPRTTWPVEMESKNPASRNYAHWITSVHELCRSYLEATRERMGRYYDRSKKDAPHYAVGDMVMLNSVVHRSTNRGGSHGPHRTATVRFVSWQTANRPATARFGFLANRTTNRAVPRHGFEPPRFANRDEPRHNLWRFVWRFAHIFRVKIPLNIFKYNYHITVMILLRRV